MTKSIHNNKFKYKLFYRDANQKRHEIAKISLSKDGSEIFVYYLPGAVVKYPTLRSENVSSNFDSLWMRVPSNLRSKSRDFSKTSLFDEFVTKFKGRVATDRFEFTKA